MRQSANQLVLMSGIFDGCCFILSGGQLLKRSIIAAGLLFASPTKYTIQVARNIFRQKGKVLGGGNLICHEYGKWLREALKKCFSRNIS